MGWKGPIFKNIDTKLEREFLTKKKGEGQLPKLHRIIRSSVLSCFQTPDLSVMKTIRLEKDE